jgi:hypothetical protein
MIYNQTNGMMLLKLVEKDLTMQKNPISSFTKDIVFHYAKYSRTDGCYLLNVSDLPDFEIHKFAALLMADDESYASESTGSDNDQFKKTLLPSLIRYMKDTTDRDEQIEFVQSWRDGVASYFSPKMQELIDEECSARFLDEKYESRHYPKRHVDNGEIYWSRSL